MVWEKYAVAQSTETGKIQSNKRKEKKWLVKIMRTWSKKHKREGAQVSAPQWRASWLASPTR
jgi:hypothetical protein